MSKQKRGKMVSNFIFTKVEGKARITQYFEQRVAKLIGVCKVLMPCRCINTKNIPQWGIK